MSMHLCRHVTSRPARMGGSIHDRIPLFRTLMELHHLPHNKLCEAVARASGGRALHYRRHCHVLGSWG